MSALPISRLICQHDFFWSRRRQADVCRRCGAISPVLALHFRSKAAWTVGADLPPERGEAFHEMEDAPDAEPPALMAPDSAPSTSASAADDPMPEPVLDPSPPVAPTPILDFSGRGGASLTTPLVTFGLSGGR